MSVYLDPLRRASENKVLSTKAYVDKSNSLYAASNKTNLGLAKDYDKINM